MFAALVRTRRMASATEERWKKALARNRPTPVHAVGEVGLVLDLEDSRMFGAA